MWDVWGGVAHSPAAPDVPAASDVVALPAVPCVPDAPAVPVSERRDGISMGRV